MHYRVQWTVVRGVSLKHRAAAACGAALLLFAVDSAIAHFAGKGISRWQQVIPVGFGVVGAFLLVGLLLPDIRRSGGSLFRFVVRGVGGASCGVGAAGVAFHLVPLLRDLADEPFSLATVEGALSVAPPLFAPGAFVGLGVVLWMLASPRLLLRFRKPVVLAIADEPPVQTPAQLPAYMRIGAPRTQP